LLSSAAGQSRIFQAMHLRWRGLLIVAIPLQSRLVDLTVMERPAHV
jgi:hypothetical protein